MTSDLVQKAKAFVTAVASGAPRDVLAAFYAADVVQEEFPNRLLPRGAKRDLTAILDASERGYHVLASQTYEIVNAVSAGDQVMLEALWTGTLRVTMGPLKPGDVMRARFALIVRQRNYDCFECWEG